jgi:YidC/Oxa1 family membrane protein insertase
VILPRPNRRQIGLLALIAFVVLVASACAPLAATTPLPSGATHAPTPVPTPLVPAQPGADPLSLLAWLFTPVFKALFIVLVVFYNLTGNIAIAIVLLTLVIRSLIIPLFRRQTVSQRRMQLLQPEIKEINKRYKGDRAKISEATMALYKERGVNPAAGCLPLVLQFVLLIPMYSVIRDGLTSYDPTAMLEVFGFQVPLTCQNLVNGVPTPPEPCINTIAFGVNWATANILFPLPVIGGLSILAVVSGLLQLVQSRMVMPPAAENDTQSNVQRQTMVIFPFISIAYGGFLPSGLFLYWIVTTIFSIIQQYLIVGFGSLFPLFGRTPGFAKDHTPRFPVAAPTAIPPRNVTPGRSSAPKGAAPPATPRLTPTDRAASAAATVRPRERGRQGRRGRRR